MSQLVSTKDTPLPRPPVALFDASHGQKRWAQTGFPSREMHTNFSGITEVLCRRGLDLRIDTIRRCQASGRGTVPPGRLLWVGSQSDENSPARLPPVQARRAETGWPRTTRR